MRHKVEKKDFERMHFDITLASSATAEGESKMLKVVNYLSPTLGLIVNFRVAAPGYTFVTPDLEKAIEEYNKIP